MLATARQVMARRYRDGEVLRARRLFDTVSAVVSRATRSVVEGELVYVMIPLSAAGKPLGIRHSFMIQECNLSRPAAR